MINNHIGYGLRNDEKPFAHKIPQGGNWYSLSDEDQLAYWNGKKPTGSTNGLRRRAWNEPAGTITTTPLQKLACQLHPGGKEMIENHFGHLFDNIGKSGRADFRRKGWNESGYVIDTKFRCNYIHPGEKEGGIELKNYDVTPQQPKNGLTVAELFAGGGLMAVGLKTAGFDLVWANDFSKAQCETYEHNFGPHIVHGDITQIEIDSIPDTDIIAGGPPCQDFSVAGKHEGEKGKTGHLVWRYLEIIERKQPKAFIFENVKGLVGSKHIHTFKALLEQFNRIGYRVSHKVLSAWDYGVAQKRERVFIVGIRNDLGFEYQFPEPLKEDYQTQTLWDAIGDLPEIENQESRRFTVRECLRIQSAPDWYIIPENVSLSKQYEIVGNGVACRVAWYLGKALAEQLEQKAVAKVESDIERALRDFSRELRRQRPRKYWKGIE